MTTAQSPAVVRPRIQDRTAKIIVSAVLILGPLVVIGPFRTRVGRK